jgi:hypothetical protein
VLIWPGRLASFLRVGLVVLAACGPGGGVDDDDDDPDPPRDAALDAVGVDAVPPGPPWYDFPATPIIDSGAPANAPALFAGAGAPSGGPCLIEPQIGTLFPRNWLRPRFNLAPVGAQNLFELRLEADDEANDLVVYTTNRSWTLPLDLWQALAAHVVDAPITVSVRGAVWDGQQLTTPPALGTQGTFTIAPVDANGSIVYWTTSGGTSLKGFAVGDETVHSVLTTAQSGATECIGCHSSTPDGTFVAFSAYDAATPDRNRRVDLRSVDGAAAPTFLTPAAASLLARVDQNAPSFSPAHWAPGDRIALTMYQPRPGSVTEIIWTDLETQSMQQNAGWGIVARSGDTRSAASATFSHDGNTIAYVSALSVDQSGTAHGEGDLYSVPYAGGAGGAATPIAGAANPNLNEYYPDFSSDDRLLAFNRAAGGSYDNPNAEVFVIPAGGGTATRLAANDPNVCLGTQSPGVTNSWPKWAPGVSTVGARTYYWLTFSSRRAAGALPQLYVSGVVIEGTTVTTYPAIYLWNQPADQNNHTPAWDELDIID